MRTIGLLASSTLFLLCSVAQGIAQGDEEYCNKYYGPPGSARWNDCMGIDNGNGEESAKVDGDRVSKGPGKCGAYTYYDKKKKKCMDARTKK